MSYLFMAQLRYRIVFYVEISLPVVYVNIWWYTWAGDLNKPYWAFQRKSPADLTDWLHY